MNRIMTYGYIGAACSVLLLTSCGVRKNSGFDVRLSLVTQDGSMNEIPTSFFDALTEAQPNMKHLQVLPLEGREDKVSKRLQQLLDDSSVICRLYWKSIPGSPPLSKLNALHCSSGAVLHPVVATDMVDLMGLVNFHLQAQYFIVPKSESPASFVAQNGSFLLGLRSPEQVDEEKGWGEEWIITTLEDWSEVR